MATRYTRRQVLRFLAHGGILALGGTVDSALPGAGLGGCRRTARPTATAIAQSANPLLLTLAAGVALDLVRVPAGDFIMGSAPSDREALGDERPQHTVSLDEYLIGKYEVTVSQYRAFVQAAGRLGWAHPDSDMDSHPADGVSWDDAVAFCAWASQVTGRNVRLPTEAEWEKAARGTDGRLYPWGDAAPDGKRCNFRMDIGDTTPIGCYSPQGDSPYGCADMAGNVWEWVGDRYQENYYAQSPSRNPTGPTSGQYRAMRGGGFSYSAPIMRAALRSGSVPDDRSAVLGFRACVAPIS